MIRTGRREQSTQGANSKPTPLTKVAATNIKHFCRCITSLLRSIRIVRLLQFVADTYPEQYLPSDHATLTSIATSSRYRPIFLLTSLADFSTTSLALNLNHCTNNGIFHAKQAPLILLEIAVILHSLTMGLTCHSSISPRLWLAHQVRLILRSVLVAFPILNILDGHHPGIGNLRLIRLLCAALKSSRTSHGYRIDWKVSAPTECLFRETFQTRYYVQIRICCKKEIFYTKTSFVHQIAQE